MGAEIVRVPNEAELRRQGILISPKFDGLKMDLPPRPPVRLAWAVSLAGMVGGLFLCLWVALALRMGAGLAFSAKWIPLAMACAGGIGLAACGGMVIAGWAAATGRSATTIAVGGGILTVVERLGPVRLKRRQPVTAFPTSQSRCPSRRRRRRSAV